jgi:hypothetical protein
MSTVPLHFSSSDDEDEEEKETPTPILPPVNNATPDLKRATTVQESEVAEQQVVVWLDQIGKGYAKKYAAAMIDEGFDSLVEMEDVTMDDLENAGVKKAHARKILAAASGLAGSLAATAAAATTAAPATAPVQPPAIAPPTVTSALDFLDIDTTPRPMVPPHAPVNPIPPTTTPTSSSSSSSSSSPLFLDSAMPEYPWVIAEGPQRLQYERQHARLQLPILCTYAQVRKWPRIYIQLRSNVAQSNILMSLDISLFSSLCAFCPLAVLSLSSRCPLSILSLSSLHVRTAVALFATVWVRGGGLDERAAIGRCQLGRPHLLRR